MVLVSTQIEIESSPEHVREVFTDFPRIPEWTQGFIKSIEPQAPKDKPEKGDKLKVVLQGTTFHPTVLENSSSRFVWRGSLWGLFVGDHSFVFEPSEKTPGATTFTQSEAFSGPLAFLMSFSSSNNATTGFDEFNNDLKRKVESGA